MAWLAALLACGGTPSDPAPTGPIHQLTVEGGFGSGAFAAGTTVHVWADVDPQVEVASWGAGVSSPEEWNTDLVMPDQDLVVTATTTSISAPLTSRTYVIPSGERTVLGSFTASPIGLVLFFHGASYAVDELQDNAARTVTMHLVRAGYAVVAVPSEAEVASGVGGWNSSLADSNPDLVTVRAIVDALRADGTISADLPIYAWGMSSGGIFAHAVGAVLPTAGVVANCAAGTPEALETTSAPTGWYMAADDQTFPTGVEDAKGFRVGLTVRGIESELYVHPQTPLYDERFERVTGIDSEKSAEIASAIRAAGGVGPTGAWTMSGGAVLPALELEGLDAKQLTAVGAEIEIMAADHELYDDVAARMTAFLLAR